MYSRLRIDWRIRGGDLESPPILSFIAVVQEGCPVGKQWAFITFVHQEDALSAKEACDRKLLFEGSQRPCDVMLAKNQGQETQGTAAKATKIFVGSLPDGIDEGTVREEFGRYGQVEERSE